MVPHFIFSILIFMSGLSSLAAGSEFSYRNSTRVNSMGLRNLSNTDPTSLDSYKIVNMSANVEVGTSCGEMNISTNLQSNLKDLLGDDFFKGVGNQIQGAGGMLALCYLSPSYCSIAKHMRMSSHFLSQLNLDSCAMIDKYVDNRVADYDMSKQQCVRKKMGENGRDVKAALEECGSGNPADQMGDWAGGKGGKVNANELIGSTAKWAGLSGADSNRIIQMTKAFVGDTVVVDGGVRVEFGGKSRLTSPREYISEQSISVAERLNTLVDDLNGDNPQTSFSNLTKKKIVDIFEKGLPDDVAEETVRRLSYLPNRSRREAVQRLAQAVAVNNVTQDAEKSLEVLTLASRNPNLPPHRQKEAIELRQQLKDSLEMALDMKKSGSEQLREVLGSIQKDGSYYESGVVRRSLEGQASSHNKGRLNDMFFDCSDSTFCSGGKE